MICIGLSIEHKGTFLFFKRGGYHGRYRLPIHPSPLRPGGGGGAARDRELITARKSCVFCLCPFDSCSMALIKKGSVGAYRRSSPPPPPLLIVSISFCKSHHINDTWNSFAYSLAYICTIICMLICIHGDSVAVWKESSSPLLLADATDITKYN